MISNLHTIALSLGINELILIDKERFKKFLYWAIKKWKEEINNEEKN